MKAHTNNSGFDSTNNLSWLKIEGYKTANHKTNDLLRNDLTWVKEDKSSNNIFEVEVFFKSLFLF